ncbi:MAG TPA: FAD-binding oxidoreductase [Actinomycetota bacterium]|nr:FAD-binding oxidoreductase [Actinomycetota bacterium]
MDLIHPANKGDVLEAVREANAQRHRLFVVGGRRHADKGNPTDADAELWTTQLDRLVAYEPAEMIVVVEAGMRLEELRRILAGGGQEWPADAPDDATVGGVVVSGATSPRRLKVGALRDSVLEAEIVTGDGRFVRSGARTVKNVTGYDLHKLVAGSLGTLGVVVQLALKVRPLPQARRTVVLPGSFELAGSLLEAVPAAASVLVTPDGLELRLEGWPAEVEDQTEAAAGVGDVSETSDDAPFPSARPWAGAGVVAEVAVPPSRLDDVFKAEPALAAWGALAGVGIAWVGLENADGPLTELRARAAAAGGIAPVVHGPGGLGNAPIAAEDVQRRLKAAFDPNGVLAPGRGWAGF